MLDVPFPETWDDSRIATIETLASQWRSLTPLSTDMKLAQKSYDEDFLVRMAYNSNAIEGSTLTLADTEIIFEGEFVPGKPGREQIAARGIFEGSAFLSLALSERKALDEPLLRDLHERCALDLQPGARGMYRLAPAIIRASRTTPVAPMKIREAISNLFYRDALLAERTLPLVRIPWFHATFEAIHPFADGNGRTGRLWMNAQLQASGFPPICIKVDHSIEYKESLEAWQVDKDPKPFLDLFHSSLEAELRKRIDFLSEGPSEAPGLAKATPHGKEILGLLAQQPSRTTRDLSDITGLSERQCQRVVRQLREAGILARTGSSKKGQWVVENTDSPLSTGQ